MNDTVLLPETVLEEPGVLKDWLRKALAFRATLPPKKKTKATIKKAPVATKKPAPKRKKRAWGAAPGGHGVPVSKTET